MAVVGVAIPVEVAAVIVAVEDGIAEQAHRAPVLLGMFASKQMAGGCKSLNPHRPRATVCMPRSRCWRERYPDDKVTAR